MKYLDEILPVLFCFLLLIVAGIGLFWPFRKFYAVRRADRLHQKGRFFLERSDFKPASVYILKASRLFKKTAQTRCEAECWKDLSYIYRQSNRLDEAFVLADFAQHLYQSLKDDFEIGNLLAEKASIFARRYDFENAIRYYTESLGRFKRAKAEHRTIDTLNAVIPLHIGLKQTAKARRTLEKVRALLLKTTYPDGEALCSLHASYLDFAGRKYETSLTHARHAKKIYRRNNHTTGMAEASFLEARSLHSLARYTESERICRQIDKMARQNDVFFTTADLYSLRGLNALQNKKFNSALTFFEHAMQEELAKNNIGGALSDCANLILVCKKSGHSQKCRAYQRKYKEFLNQFSREISAKSYPK